MQTKRGAALVTTCFSDRVNSPNLYNPEVSRKPPFKSHPPLWWTYNMTVPGWYVKICCMRHRDICWLQMYAANIPASYTRTHELQQNSRISSANVCISVKRGGGLGWGGSFRKRNFICLNCKEIQFRAKLLLTQGLIFFYFSCLPLSIFFFYMVCLAFSLFKVSKFKRMCKYFSQSVCGFPFILPCLFYQFRLWKK